MDEKTLKEINLYCNPYSVLVIDKQRNLKRIFCPFKVRVIKEISLFKIGDELYVTSVKTDRNNNLILIIKGEGYLNKFFKIL